jgi:hypothetical protein
MDSGKSEHVSPVEQRPNSTARRLAKRIPEKKFFIPVYAGINIYKNAVAANKAIAIILVARY